MEPDMNEEPGLLESWKNHPFTRQTLKAFRKEEEADYKAFTAACETTNDPKVAKAYTAWRSSARLVKAFSGDTKAKR